MLEIRLLGTGDAALLDILADGVFDEPIDREFTRAFLSDEHNHLAVGILDGSCVGFASGIDYVHPDKPRQLWINEVGVAPEYRRIGIAHAVVALLIEHARSLGCTEAWVLTDEDNLPARSLYKKCGGYETPAIMITFPLPPLSP